MLGCRRRQAQLAVGARSCPPWCRTQASCFTQVQSRGKVEGTGQGLIHTPGRPSRPSPHVGPAKVKQGVSQRLAGSSQASHPLTGDRLAYIHSGGHPGSGTAPQGTWREGHGVVRGAHLTVVTRQWQEVPTVSTQQATGWVPQGSGRGQLPPSALHLVT